MYAVWPGHYRSDLFLVDDIDEYEKALGLQHETVRTGLEDHEHQIEWQISPSEQKPTGSYVLIEATLVCGCEIRDLRSFAGQMRVQRGWDVAVSGGWGGHASTYSFRVRRKSLG